MLGRFLFGIVTEQFKYLLRNFYGGSDCGKYLS